MSCKTRWFGVCATLLFFVVYVIERNRAHLVDLASSSISDNLIPMVIVQLGKGNGTHDSSIRRTNPGFDFLYFNDDDINKFLELNYPDFLKSFRRLPLKIMKIDFFRYISIYHFGGFYFDQDVEGVNPLDENIRNHDAVFPVDTYLDLHKCQNTSEGYNSRFKEFCANGAPIVPFLLGQYAFGAKKQSSFIKSLVNHIHNHAEQYKTLFNNNSILDYNYVYKTTGPDFVTSVYVDAQTMIKDGVFVLRKEPWMIWETLFAPVLGKRDRSRTNPYRYFGNYAVHLNRGSWKAGGGKAGGGSR